MKLLMTSGRTIRQGEQLYYKDQPSYAAQTSLCYINPVDLAFIGVEEGDLVRIKSVEGETVFKTVSTTDVRRGMVFIPCGPHANFIIHSKTHGTGAPDYKWLDVDVVPAENGDRILSAWEILEAEGGLRYNNTDPGCPTKSENGDCVINDVVCPLCGCLCDDITLTIKNNEITGVDNGCALSSGKFLAKHRLKQPIMRTGSGWKNITYDEAIRYTADMLLDAQRPLLFGWSGTYGEAQCMGISIAEMISGVIDNCSSICHGPSIMAIQEAGHPGCTLGQIKNRADLIVYWGSNPIESHPRHMSRYSMYADGYFLHDAFRDRKMIVVDIRKTDVAKNADEFIQIKPGGDYAVFSALRAIVRGRADVIPDMVSGVTKEKLVRVADMCMNAKFGVFFTGIGLTESPGKYKNVKNGVELVDELCRHTKFTLTPMRGHWNVYGTNQTFTYMGGYPYAIDFSRGTAFYNPGETSAVDLLVRGEVDACVIIGSDPGAHLPRKCNERLSKIPCVVIDPFPSMSTATANVQIPVAMCGVDCGGTAYRLDAIPLWVKKVMDSPQQNDLEVLTKIRDIIAEAKGK
ncbi:formylmethanofuran dehydrogenase subunit B [Methanomicrobium sp. W14]|uniref:formylmethanofuran dehydrogenase subunit B n=1 Tax=Methanomicrobium sp. W14 TaxID=2817839 RepID=UPI002479905C|nr:formylmethanofuran dehydrogenase subunit B [Methanomicrobium sp. W14]MBP2134020.1 formylmethanofuran dehydrogenase subunit B [Methanomicrobium sp. W14]